MKRSQRLTVVFLILLLLCACSSPAAPNTGGLPQTPAEGRAEPSPVPADNVQAEPETETFHLEYEQTALPEPLLSVTALNVLDEALLLGGFSDTGLALVRLTPDGRSKELPLPGGTEYLYAICPDGAGGAWLLCGSLPKGCFDASGNFRFLSKDPEGKLALAHYDAAFAMQEIVLLQTLYTEQFFRMYRLGAFRACRRRTAFCTRWRGIFTAQSFRSCANLRRTRSPRWKPRPARRKSPVLASARMDGCCWETAKSFLHRIPAPVQRRRLYSGGNSGQT